MSFEPRKTKRGYCMFVENLPLYKRAKELGFQNVILFDRTSLSEAEINALKNAKCNVAFVFFDAEEHPPKRVRLIFKHLYTEEPEIQCSYYNLIDFVPEELREGITLENALDFFPDVVDLEGELIHDGVANAIDYDENQCGNCQAWLRPGDRYCRNCGTERGKGLFLPYLNPSYCVYGPPIKKKHKCSECGHIWIGVELGGDNSNFCPMCGKAPTKVIEQKVGWENYFGAEEPYDVGERPVLLEKKQIKKLLSMRKKGKKFYGEDLVGAMDKAGIEVTTLGENANLPKTELDGERMTLASRILSSKGSRCPGNVVCPHCQSDWIASFVYEVFGYDRILDMHFSFKTGDDDKGIRFYERGTIHAEAKYHNTAMAFCCLQCGEEFEEFAVSDYFPKPDKESNKE